MKAVVAQDLGHDVFTLLVVVAMTQDSNRHKSLVTFYSRQLIDVCGFGSESTLFRIRKKAVDAGWLTYEAGAKRKPAKYAIRLPSGVPLFHGDVSATADEFDDPKNFRNTQSNLTKNPVSIGENTPSPVMEYAARIAGGGAAVPSYSQSLLTENMARKRCACGENATALLPTPTPTPKELNTKTGATASLCSESELPSEDPPPEEAHAEISEATAPSL